MIENHIKLEMLSKGDNVALARVTVAAFASQIDFTLGELEEIKVAVSEAVSNAIIHGYGEKMGMVTVAVSLMGDAVEIIISDQGQGIENVVQAMQPSYTTRPERMGLGFVFMESFMDQLNVDTKVGVGTTITLVKKAKQLSDGES